MPARPAGPGWPPTPACQTARWSAAATSLFWRRWQRTKRGPFQTDHCSESGRGPGRRLRRLAYIFNPAAGSSTLTGPAVDVVTYTMFTLALLFSMAGLAIPPVHR
ncbi:hypothetical protein Lfu02_40560 [Longispora fulva]|nr:hypothetical protein Lfu02_40560 [Longispora fulva]